MNRVKYYNLVESGVTDYFNIGVVVIKDGVIPEEAISIALTAHFDAEIRVKSVEIDPIGASIGVVFDIERDGQMETEYAIGHQTWIYN